MYDGIYLTFSQDGTFVYTNPFFYTGTYQRKSEDSFILKTTRAYKMTLKDGEVVEEELENLPIYIVTVRQDEKLRFAQMDIMTGAEITDETPKIFSKE